MRTNARRSTTRMRKTSFSNRNYDVRQWPGTRKAHLLVRHRSGLIAARVIFDQIPLQGADLPEQEHHQGDGKPKGLNLDPCVGGHGAPDHFIGDGQRCKQRTKAAGQDHPSLIPHRHCIFQDKGQPALPTQKADAQKGGKEAVNDARLHLEKPLVIEPGREATEKDHHEGGENLHPAELARHDPEDRHGDQQDRHKDQRGHYEARIFGAAHHIGVVADPQIDQEKDQRWAQFEHLFQDRVNLARVRHGLPLIRPFQRSPHQARSAPSERPAGDLPFLSAPTIR
mmetsp:Transcript_24029/g.44200  ORF Transcript_24029/g.44200 Transcript_24029/m.44200 type:complete len:283 (+) Transcript_24029:632-1480(+)